MVGKIEGRKRRRPQRKRWLDSITASMDLSLGKFLGIVKGRAAWYAVVHCVAVRCDLETVQQLKCGIMTNI